MLQISTKGIIESTAIILKKLKKNDRKLTNQIHEVTLKYTTMYVELEVNEIT